MSKKVVYGALQASSKELYEIKIDQELRKSRLLSFQKYKEEMKRKADEVKTTDRDMKLVLKMNEIVTMKMQKMTIHCSIEVLKEGIFTETLAADEKRDLSLTAKAASFCRSLKYKEQTLEEYNDIILNLEKEYKAI